MKLNYERNDDTESVATMLRRFFFYFIIAAESVAETSEHGIQTNGEQRALNVVGIGFKPWIFLETIESAAKFIFIAKESLSLFSLNK